MSHRTTAHRQSRPASVALGFAACLGALTGCASTTYDDSLASPPSTSVETSTTLPTGAAGELLPRLRDEAAALSGVMVAEGDDDAAVDRIAALWNAVSPEVLAERPDLYDSFGAAVALAQRGVTFSRAADADKASMNIDALVAAFLGS